MEKQQLIITLSEIAKPYFHEDDPTHDFSHTNRVLHNALKIHESEGGDKEILIAAALLHDIGRRDQKISNGAICHAKRGAELSRPILENLEFPKEKIPKVLHAIETHRFRKSKPPETTEAMIIYDADKLDAIGAIGIARAVSYSGQTGARVHHSDKEELISSAEHSKYDCAYREFLIKLFKIKEKMLTPTGRELALNRHDYMTEFFEKINREVEGLE